LEQEIVASLVQVETDPPVDNLVISDNPLFHLMRDDHHDVFSFSSKPELFGGVGVSFPCEEEGVTTTIKNQQAVAAYVIVDRRTLEVVYHDHEYFVFDIPYMPAYLAFREIAPLQVLIHRQAQKRPDLTPQAILVDGNGILHPRHAGIACFLGTRTNIPTIGIGTSLLYEGDWWTGETLNYTVDNFLKELHDAIDQNPQTLAPHLSRFRGLIMKKTGEDPTTCSSSSSSNDYVPPAVAAIPQAFDRNKILQDLAPFCNGVAIPLKGEKDDTRFPFLGCALVGHGGQIAPSSRTSPVAGTAEPIFVSVGHKISLPRAVQITASLSMARVPEPVRQADLYSREMLRKK
jgi:deoxyinosine 3'endonuclease (endonuclease V)